MAPPGRRDCVEDVGDHASKSTAVEEGILTKSPLLPYNVHTVAVGSRNTLEPGPGFEIEPDQRERDSSERPEDQWKTHGIALASSTNTSSTIEQSGAMQSHKEQQSPPGTTNTLRLEQSRVVQAHDQQQSPDDVVEPIASRNVDYFASQASHSSNPTDFTSSELPGQGANTSSRGLPTTRTIASPSRNDGPITWKDFSSSQPPVVSASASNLPNSRPTSVPIAQSKPTSRRREGPDYPNYPDQSFRALQDQHYPPPYRPGSPRPLRTRSSHPSQSSSFAPSDSQSSADLPRIPSGAKTVGNTPAPSPGLFSPTFPAKRQWPNDPDEGRSTTPMLHPTHQKPPKETHKLTKDIDPISGRKTINHYEIFQKLGSGQHGTVKQGRDLETGEMVAIKIVRRFSKKLRLGRSGDPNDMIRKEVAILKKARHPHVVSLIEVIDDHEFGKVYLVLEYVERGEIIWRKQTDKDIAAFEMARTQREIKNNINDAFERSAVVEFNNGAPTRRLEKTRLLDQQKRQAKDRFGTGSSRSFGQSRSNFWSLEFEGDTESEVGPETQAKVEPEGSMALSLPESSPQSQSPSHTPRPLPQSIDSGSAPASVPSSRPRTPANLEGTMWGPYLKEDSPDLGLQRTLDEIIAGHTQWNPDEEDFRYVPCLTLSQALDAFRDTVLGLEYLHYQGIIHRDIKPANLLWTTDYRVKISDFGVSYLGKPIREDDNKEEIPEADAAILDEAIELAKTVGTPAFYAPELCDPQYFDIGSDRPAITGQIDVWALGVTLYGMVFGRLPFYHHNEFQMYERIAREEVFIPRMRLRGVEHTDKTPSNLNKRLDDVLEYEEVDDEIRDLLKRLLNKQPAKRITLKEVKHHPWVLRGISDQMSWMDETDPSLQSQGRKIEVSTQEVQDAVVGLTLVDRVKAGFQRVGSVLRGRGSRKRADSNPRTSEPTPVAAASDPMRVQSTVIKDGRRTSLRGDEQIYTALRASRENSEHPLAQSVAVSPELRSDLAYFDEAKPARPVSDPQASRPAFPDRTLSTADSMKTIRASAPLTVHEASSANTSSPNEDFSMMTAVPDSNQSSSSSLGGIFGGAGRRFVNSMRSRERGVGRQSPSQTSRSSSVERGLDDPHASPSLALSSAIAAGHLDQPPALREEIGAYHHVPNESTTEAFERAQEQNNRRQIYEYRGHARRPTVALAAEVACPPSPDDETFFAQQRPASATDSTTGFQVSSSSDQILSGESTVTSRIPSVISGASSLSATIEELGNSHATHLEKSIAPPVIGQRDRSLPWEERSDEALSTKQTLAPAAVEDEAGYNGEGELDSDSEDEGLAMA